MDNLINATKEDLIKIEDFGEIMAQGVVDYWADEKHVKDVKTLIERGVIIEERVQTEGVFSGMKVVLTGSLYSMKRPDAKKLIEQKGGQCADSISKAVNLVIVGEDAGSKLEKARKLGIKTITEAEFLEMLKM